MGEEQRKVVKEEVNKLPNDKWRMSNDYTDLNKACPKDPYPLPSIDKLVNGASDFQVLSSMDVYSGYNQIQKHALDKEKIAFITKDVNF